MNPELPITHKHVHVHVFAYTKHTFNKTKMFVCVTKMKAICYNVPNGEEDESVGEQQHQHVAEGCQCEYHGQEEEQR